MLAIVADSSQVIVNIHSSVRHYSKTKYPELAYYRLALHHTIVWVPKHSLGIVNASVPIALLHLQIFEQEKEKPSLKLSRERASTLLLCIACDGGERCKDYCSGG